MAMTIAAQLFTLPIQVLIEPELPVYSIPANLVVAPFVGFSTLAGLASLAISWILPSLGFIFASLASWGTAIMEFMALNLGSGDHATIPWTGDAGGALLIILVEIIGYTTARFAGTLFARITTTEPNLPADASYTIRSNGQKHGATNLQRAQDHEMERMNLVHRYSEIEYYAETIRNNALPPHLRR